MSNCDSDMSFDSTTTNMLAFYESDSSETFGSLSDEEYKECEEAKRRVIENKDEIAEKVRTAKREKRSIKNDIVYFDSKPHILSNGRYIQVLSRFNFVADLVHWFNKQIINNDFEEWLMVPRTRRVPYSPLKLGGSLTFSGESFNYKSLYIENLSSKTSGIQLREIFSRYGYIRDVYIPVNHMTGEKCNYAFIEIHPFNDISQILSEMATFSLLNGKSMRVQIAISGRRSASEMRTRYVSSNSRYSYETPIKKSKEDMSNGRFDIDIYV